MSRECDGIGIERQTEGSKYNSFVHTIETSQGTYKGLREGKDELEVP